MKIELGDLFRVFQNTTKGLLHRDHMIVFHGPQHGALVGLDAQGSKVVVMDTVNEA